MGKNDKGRVLCDRVESVIFNLRTKFLIKAGALARMRSLEIVYSVKINECWPHYKMMFPYIKTKM